MSRIGQRTIAIPSGVTVTATPTTVEVKGTKGTLSAPVHNAVTVKVTGDGVIVEKKHNAQIAQAMWGTMARIIENMTVGVTEGFTKQLELSGVGYRMAVKGKTVDLALGFSHPVVVPIPDDLTVTIEGHVMTIAGIDKQHVGQFAADIRALKKMEPYKGKGFKYVDEQVRRKEGKKASAA